MNKRSFVLFIAMIILAVFLLTACGSGEEEIPQQINNGMTEDSEDDGFESDSENETGDGKDEYMILVNQVGYGVNDPKMVIFTGKADSFDVIDKASGKTVFTGKATDVQKDMASGDEVCYGDFSDLREHGTYYISVNGKVNSPEFTISERPYQDIKNALLKAFYYQRCGIRLEEKYADAWSHDECHTNDGYLFDDRDQYIDATGGWHDAGDYGKYIVPAAKAVADLMLAYEHFPETFEEQINIPESGNGVPDILNEVRYELEWMLKMQEPKSFGVYHKIATLNFPGFIMPETDTGNRYINHISATATADFSAAMAMGYRVYKSVDGEFAARMLESAEKAWEWLEDNPVTPGFTNPMGVNSGEYGDSNDGDERFWAAVELYRATGKQKYHDYIKKANDDTSFSKTGFGWANVGGYGTISYLMIEKDKTDQNVYERLKSLFLEEADRLVNISAKEGYKVALGPDEYYWGSNGEVMNRAMHLILANIINANDTYINTARHQFNYILGCNALNQCYVTGFGANPVKYPHHRPSGADKVKDPVPGLLSGGPNSRRQDPAAEGRIPKDTPPAKAFIDDVSSYSTNEIAIYWNSPAVFVAAYFDR